LIRAPLEGPAACTVHPGLVCTLFNYVRCGSLDDIPPTPPSYGGVTRQRLRLNDFRELANRRAPPSSIECSAASRAFPRGGLFPFPGAEGNGRFRLRLQLRCGGLLAGPRRGWGPAHFADGEEPAVGSTVVRCIRRSEPATAVAFKSIPTWPADDGSQVDRTTSVIANRLAQSPRESRRGACQETGLLRHHRLLSAGVPPPLRHGTRCGPPRSCWASTKEPEKEECKEVEAVAPPFGAHTHGVRVASMGHGRARWRWRSSNSGPPCSEQ